MNNADAGHLRCSIVIATRNKAPYLFRTLASIRRQNVPFAYELLVVDDGSTDDTAEICREADASYFRLDNDHYRNPSVARNHGYRRVRGDVVICQSDDVIHEINDAIERLTCDLAERGEFLIATVHNYDVAAGRRKEYTRGLTEYTGLNNQRPFFFLGSLWRRDLFTAGGNSEDFTAPAFEDDWKARCLIDGLGLKPRFLPNVIGLHQDHPRPAGLPRLVRPSEILYASKVEEATRGDIPWQASGGPWPYVAGKALIE